MKDRPNCAAVIERKSCEKLHPRPHFFSLAAGPNTNLILGVVTYTLPGFSWSRVS
jgi:hypothetical protein